MQSEGEIGDDMVKKLKNKRELMRYTIDPFIMSVSKCRVIFLFHRCEWRTYAHAQMKTTMLESRQLGALEESINGNTNVP